MKRRIHATVTLVEWWKAQRYDMVTYLPTRLTVYLDAIARLVVEALKEISTLYWFDAPAPEEMRRIARRALEEK